MFFYYLVAKCQLNFKPTTPNPVDYKSGPRSIAIGDFNNDTWLDIAIANNVADHIAIYFGYGNRTAERPIIYPTGSGSAPYMIAVGDFDNDHRLDLAIANFGTNSIYIFL